MNKAYKNLSTNIKIENYLQVRRASKKQFPMIQRALLVISIWVKLLKIKITNSLLSNFIGFVLNLTIKPSMLINMLIAVCIWQNMSKQLMLVRNISNPTRNNHKIYMLHQVKLTIIYRSMVQLQMPFLVLYLKTIKIISITCIKVIVTE